MNNLVLLILTLLGIMTIYKISFDNISENNSSYSLSFCAVIAIFYISELLVNTIEINFNSLYTCIAVGFIFLIGSLIYSKKIDIKNFKHLVLAILIAIIAMVYAGKYAPYVTLTGEMNIISFLSSFTNNQIPFYQLFYSLFDIYNLNATINTIPLFNSLLVFLFFFLLSNSLFIYSKNNTINIVGLLSYFVFFISFACFKFPYIYYMWLVFPINVIFNFIDKKQPNIGESISIAIAYFSIFVILNNPQLSITIMSIILIINELSGTINDLNYKFILILLFFPMFIIDFYNNIYIIYFILLIVVSILIKLIKLKKLTYIVVTILLVASIIYNHDFSILNIYALDNTKTIIDFFNFDSNKIYLIFTYLVLFIVSLVNFKSYKRFNKQITLSLLVVFNPFILNILAELFDYSYIIIFILINPKTITLLLDVSYRLLSEYNLNNNFVVACAILVSFCSSSVLYPNIYDNFNYEDDKIHRMSTDELDIYEYIYDNDIDISGNVISHAPNTAAYFSDINLLNDFYYYTQLSDEEKTDAPDNLTNIFSLRNFAEQEFFNQERDYNASFEELKKEDYSYIIFRRDQSIFYKDFYAPLYHLYKDIYDVLYENETFALMELK